MVKIIIIGAGISGLSTYLFLRKHLLANSTSSEHEIGIYEAYDIFKSNFSATALTIAGSPAGNPSAHVDDPVFTPQAIGSAIGISRNGMSVLSRLNDDTSSVNQGTAGVSLSLIEKMATRGHPIERWQISTARGFTIVDVNLDSPQKAKRTSATKEEPQLYHGIMIARQSCWEILRDRVLKTSPDAVVRKKVVDIMIGDENRRNVVMFEDGTREEADLVIGADGLRSVLRKAMYREGETETGTETDGHNGQAPPASSNSWMQSIFSWVPFFNRKPDTAIKIDYTTPQYEGLVGVGGFVPSSVLQSTGHKPGTMSVVFGPNGFFGYGYLTSTSAARTGSEGCSPSPCPPRISSPGPLAGWWSTFSSPTPYPYSTSTSSTAPKPGDFDKTLALDSLLTRHKQWQNRTITAILTYVQSDTEQHGSVGRGLEGSYPTWTTPELPHWSVNGRAVLLGDAAHALQPSSGQGACQALEDSEALSLLLRHYLGSPSASYISENLHARLTTALAKYETLRKPRVHAIYARSQRMSRMKGDMSFLTEWMMYMAIYVMRFFKDTYNEELTRYDLPAEVERALAE